MTNGTARPLHGTPQTGHTFADVKGQKLNLGCGPDVRPIEEGWTNLDGYLALPGIVQHDILSFPWPFESSSFELVYASHVLEHIPPVFRERDGALRDVLFDVFEEVHRVLKPGGTFRIRVPWGYSAAGLAHIQHYRQWRPEWFYYFEPTHTENYYSDARFVVKNWRRTRATTAPILKHAFRFGDPPIPLTSHLLVRFPFLSPILERAAELDVELQRVEQG